MNGLASYITARSTKNVQFYEFWGKVRRNKLKGMMENDQISIPFDSFCSWIPEKHNLLIYQ